MLVRHQHFFGDTKRTRVCRTLPAVGLQPFVCLMYMLGSIFAVARFSPERHGVTFGMFCKVFSSSSLHKSKCQRRRKLGIESSSTRVH